MLRLLKLVLNLIGVFKFANVETEEEKELITRSVVYIGIICGIIFTILTFL